MIRVEAVWLPAHADDSVSDARADRRVHRALQREEAALLARHEDPRPSPGRMERPIPTRHQS